MLSNIRKKEPSESSLANAAISYGGIGLVAPKLAKQFEGHISEIIADSGLLLKTAVENRVAMVKPAYIRDHKRLGRIFNRLFGVKSQHIEMSGIELLAAIRLIQETPEAEVDPQATYLVPVKTAERMLQKLN